MAFYILFDLLSGLYNQFNPMCLHVVSSDLDVRIPESSEIAVLAHAEMVTVGTDEASSNDRLHVTSNTLVIIVSSQSIG